MKISLWSPIRRSALSVNIWLTEKSIGWGVEQARQSAKLENIKASYYNSIYNATSLQSVATCRDAKGPLVRKRVFDYAIALAAQIYFNNRFEGSIVCEIV